MVLLKLIKPLAKLVNHMGANKNEQDRNDKKMRNKHN